MLPIKNRAVAVMTTAALLAAITPAFLVTLPAEAASTVFIKQPVAGKLIADRYSDDYDYSERHDRYLNRGRYRRHHNKRYQYNSYYQPKVIYNKPVGIYSPHPQVIYAPNPVFTPHQRRCVRTLYSTICN